MSITTKESLAVYAESLKISLAGLCRMFTQQNVRVVFQGKTPCTDGHVVILPEIRSLIKAGPMTQEEIDRALAYMKALKGLVWHEGGHVRYTTWSELPRHYGPTLPLHRCTNLYEDIRMEEAVIRDYPGARPDLDYVYTFYTAEKAASADYKPSKFYQVLDGIILQQKVAGYKTNPLWLRLHKRVRKFVHATRKLSAQAKTAQDTRTAKKLARKLLKMIRREFIVEKDEDEKKEEEKTTQDESSSDESAQPKDGVVQNPGFADVSALEDVTPVDPQTFFVEDKDATAPNIGGLVESEVEKNVEETATYLNYTGVHDAPYMVYTTKNDRIGPISHEEDHQLKTEDFQKYVELAGGYARLVSKLRSAFVAETKTRFVSGIDSGEEIDDMAGLTLRTTRDVFAEYQGRNTMRSTAVELSVDCSGSMSTSRGGLQRIEKARILCLVLAKVLESTPVQLSIVGWSTGPYTQARAIYDRADPATRDAYARFGSLDIRVVKEFTEPLHRHRIMALKPRGNSYDAESLRFSVARLQRTTAKRRILMLLVDGCPTPPDGHKYALPLQQQELKKAVKEARQSVELIVFSIDSPNAAVYYDDGERKESFLTIDGQTDLVKIITERLPRVLLRGNTKTG